MNTSLDPTRRRFIAGLMQGCLGVSLLRGNDLRAALEDAPKGRQGATARNVIYLYMTGGMTHLDTFGVVPGADTMGPTKTIKTSADGVFVSEHLPTVAKTMHHGVIINSMTSTQGAHAPGNYFAHTSYTARGGARHPSMGAWLTNFQGKGNPSLPGSVAITPDSRHPGAGFFEAAMAPLLITSAADGLQNSARLSAMSPEDFDFRQSLTEQLDRGFRADFNHAAVRAHADTYREALTVMRSKDLVGFDIDVEPPETHAAYGKNRFGQGCLLARRLVEHGVRHVEVALDGWDTHVDNFLKMPDLCGPLDRALGALVNDLDQRGLLKETLVVLATEFGRTPNINGNTGRDHYPKAFTTVLWGGGVRGGRIHGTTDKGIEITSKKITIPDFNATIAHALGLPLDEVVYSPAKRPFTVADKGKPVTELFG